MLESSLLIIYGTLELISASLAKLDSLVTPPIDTHLAAAGSLVGKTFIYNFNAEGTLEETSSPAESTSPYWWLDSGGRLILAAGVGRTVSGPLPSADRWRLRYKQTSALDTGDGYYPQNLFRLVTKGSWHNLEQSVRVYLADLNLTNTPNRGEWSGVFLMSRYVNKDNLYYTGVRMDGAAVIKKKFAGTYYTLAYKPIFGFGTSYDRDTVPNLIPGKQWLGLKNTIITRSDGAVAIDFYLDQGDGYELVLSVVDDGRGGVPAIKGAGRAGLRSDYLDVWYDDYRATEV